MNAPTTITTLHEFYSIIATHYAAQEPRTKEDIWYESDKRRQGNNTTISFRYVHLTFNHKILPAEVHSLLGGRYCATLTKLKMVLDTIKEEPVPVPVPTKKAVVEAVTAVADYSSVYNLYKALRERLNTRHEHTIIFMNELVQVTALVAFMEDWNQALEARFEAERCPKPVAPAPTITKQVSRYDRAAIAGKAHYYAKASNIGTYHKRFGRGMKDAWAEAKKANSLAVPISKAVILDVPKPVKIPAPITYGNGLFDHDTVSYYPSMYTLYTESRYFNSTRNHALRY